MLPESRSIRLSSLHCQPDAAAVAASLLALAAKLSLHVSCLVPQVWANYEEKPAEEFVHVSEEKERVAKYRAVYVTEISDNLHFYAQDVETGNVKPRLILKALRTSVTMSD